LADDGRLHRTAAGRGSWPLLGDADLHADRFVIGSVVAAVALVLAASAFAGAARTPVAMIASPSHVSLSGSGRAEVTVTNSGSEPLALDVVRAGFALDLRGRPRPVPRRPSWLAVAPRQLALAPGATATLTVASHVPPR